MDYDEYNDADFVLCSFSDKTQKGTGREGEKEEGKSGGTSLHNHQGFNFLVIVHNIFLLLSLY